MTDHDKKQENEQKPVEGEWTDETYPLVDADFVHDDIVTTLLAGCR